MATYRYQGRNKQGHNVTGQLHAYSKEAVADHLFAHNITPVVIKKMAGSSELLRFLVRHTGLNKPSLDEMVIFFRQMYALTRAAVPVTSVITRLAENARNPLFAETLNAIAQSVASGVNLSASMRAHPKIFSPLIVNTVAAGEASGQLEHAFMELALYLELERKALKRIKSATRYPLMVISGIGIALVIITTVVIPSFAKLFTSVGADLPLVTRIILGFSNFMMANGLLLLLVAIAAFIAFRFYIRTSGGRLRWHFWILHMPIFGSLIERSLIARFARLFAIVYHAGIPLNEGIHQVSEALDNAYISKHLTAMQEQLNSGESLITAATASNLFSPMVLQMLQVGEESGMLEDMLRYIAEFYEQEVDYDLARLDDLISPLIIIILGVMVLLLALGVFLPMWDIIDVSLKH